MKHEPQLPAWRIPACAATLLALLSAASVAQSTVSLRLSAPLGPDQDVIGFAITPDGQRAVYLADADINQVFELYVTTTDGQGTPLKLHASLPFGRTVFGFTLDPGGTRAIYHANPLSSGKLELFSVPLDGSLAPVKLNGAFGSSTGGVQSIALFGVPLYEPTPDGTRVVFVAALDLPTRADIYSAPIDGSAPAVKLNPDLSADESVSIRSRFRISPDGSRVVYQADHDTVGVNELYSVPADGSAPAVKLNGALVSGGDVITDEFAVSADSGRAVYLADQDTDGVDELYSAPLDGSSAPVKLNATLAAGGEVLRGFALSSGGRAVYRADQDTDGAVQLYSVPVDGSQAPVLLGGSSLPGRTVMHFELSPDGSRVAYCADQDAPKVFEVYCGPTDGSTPALDLGGAFPPDADVFPGMRYSPDGSRIVFVADADQNQRFDLFVVPSDASAPPLRLDPARPDADVRAFRIAPDGSRTAFLTDLVDETPELYSTPIGGGPTSKLCPSLFPGRAVLSSFVVRNDVEFYLSDQRLDDVIELFRTIDPRTHSVPSATPTRTVTRVH